jgi:hypothetical protein
MKKDTLNTGQFTEADKEACLPLIQKLFMFSVISRRSGLLALGDEMENEGDAFLKKAVKLAMDDCRPIENILNDAIEKENPTGVQLLKRLIITRGMAAIVDGVKPPNMASTFAALLGSKYADRIGGLVPAEENRG